MPPKNMTGLSIVGHFDANHNAVNHKTFNSTTYGTTYGDQFGKHIYLIPCILCAYLCTLYYSCYMNKFVAIAYYTVNVNYIWRLRYLVGIKFSIRIRSKASHEFADRTIYNFKKKHISYHNQCSIYLSCCCHPLN